MKENVCVLSAVIAVILMFCSCSAAVTTSGGTNTSRRAVSSTVSASSTGTVSENSEVSDNTSKSAGSVNPPANSATSTVTAWVNQPPAEVHGMWISYYELYPMFDKDFSKAFASALDNCKSNGINTVYVHVRSHCDAFYKSSLFPWSKYVNKVNGKQGRDPGFDPLAVMVKLAHQRGIQIHAWINPYRVLADSTDISKLADSSPAKKWLTDNDPDNDCYVHECKGGLYLDPSELAVQRLIVDGVREIVKNYDVDGIHFDDYFYPTTDQSFDEGQYARYRASVSSNPLPLEDWRRANVNALVSAVYSAVKAEDQNCIFGISPMAAVSNNYHTVFADVKAWLDGGYIDYIMPQLYFGFEYPKDSAKFDNLLKEWDELFDGRSQKLYIGLGVYRLGSTDPAFAEFNNSPDVLSRQIEMIRADGISDGFVFFSYSDFFKNDQLTTAVRKSIKDTIG